MRVTILHDGSLQITFLPTEHNKQVDCLQAIAHVYDDEDIYEALTTVIESLVGLGKPLQQEQIMECATCGIPTDDKRHYWGVGDYNFCSDLCFQHYLMYLQTNVKERLEDYGKEQKNV